ncbi:PIG-L family deacetylase [Streptomyces sp. NPDC021224]|uniref:PIG-L family deacetylase n=1 Tax=unclassified Streptomyces TaxID=2593676 RepID=UPI0037BBAF78
MTDPVPAPTGRPLFFYDPHQDDESLWAGQLIAHHSLVGREVHIVSCTDGSMSGVLQELAGLTPNSWWGGYHYPAREGIPPMTTADFVAARDRELVQAARQLGISPDRVHLRTDVRGADITVDEAKALILANEALSPGAGHYGMHWADMDTTHAAIGQALRQLLLAGQITDVRWMVRREQTTTIAGAAPYPVPAQYAATARMMALNALRCYQAWAPPQAYAIGAQSVAEDFVWAAAAGSANYIVKAP